MFSVTALARSVVAAALVLVAPALSAADPARLTAAHDLPDAINMPAQIRGTLALMGGTLPAEGDGKEKFKRMTDEEVVPEMLNLTAAGYASRLSSRLEPMKLVARTMQKHRDGILAWFDSRISNGLIEGINSIVQAAKAKARGYRNSHTLKRITYLIAGKLDLRLPT